VLNLKQILLSLLAAAIATAFYSILQKKKLISFLLLMKFWQSLFDLVSQAMVIKESMQEDIAK
jgi:hypothetical protein